MSGTQAGVPAHLRDTRGDLGDHAASPADRVAAIPRPLVPCCPAPRRRSGLATSDLARQAPRPRPTSRIPAGLAGKHGTWPPRIWVPGMQVGSYSPAAAAACLVTRHLIRRVCDLGLQAAIYQCLVRRRAWQDARSGPCSAGTGLVSRRRSPASGRARRIRRTTVAVGWWAVAAVWLVRAGPRARRPGS